MYTPAQVAKRANSHPNTIRGYADKYGELLSADPRNQGEARLFTDKDVEILCNIASLRKSGVSPDEVASRIRASETPPVIDVIPTPIHESIQEPTRGLQQADMGMWGIQVAYNGLQSEVAALRGDVAALQRRREADDRKLEDKERQWARLEGAIIALAAAGFVLWLLYLWTGI